MRISTIEFNKSHVDGPGIRTVIFMAGCDLHCNGCHNKVLWDINKGTEVEIKYIMKVLKKFCFNKKVTISGGEPLLQVDELRKLLNALNKANYNIVLYTGHQKEEVPEDIIKSVNYLKTGRFILELKTSVKPFVGSSNQLFEEVNKYEAIK